MYPLIRARIELPPEKLAHRAARFDHRESQRRIATGMLMHWRRSMLRGIMADGRSLGRNRLGLLLGIGRGTIMDGWRVVVTQAGVFVEPYQGRGPAPPQARHPAARYKIAVAMLVRRGVVYHSFKGASRKRLAALVRRETSRLAKLIATGRP